jgi:hypothetical protein
MAAIPGIIDWLSIPAGTRAKQSAPFMVWQCRGAGLIWIELAATAQRPARPTGCAHAICRSPARPWAVSTAWLGAELVYRMRVGVDDGANLDAANSLLSDA